MVLAKLLILLSLCCFTETYRRTAIVHGIMFNATDRMQFIAQEIQRSQTTEVDLLEFWYGQQSFYPMWAQVSQFMPRLQEIMTAAGPDGINLIAYSQGGLIARAIVELLPNHTVKRFISLSSPQNGFHGEYFVPNSRFYVGNEEKFSDSVGGFWKDPRDLTRYKKEGRFLACLNNEYQHPLNQQFKNAMCRLEQLVLIGGPDDGVVVPWQSAHFGYDDANGRIIPMEQQTIYQKDSICLQTLNRRGAITTYTVPGVRHPDWHNSPSVIQNYVLPHLA